MRFTINIKKNISKIWNLLKEPNRYLYDMSSNKFNIRRIIIAIIVFLMIGFLLNLYWNFPHFIEFVICFIFIGLLSLWAITYYSKKMGRITSALINQPAAKKTNLLYFRYHTKSIVFVLVPLGTVIVFGTGGCSMFKAISITPTFIWILILFFFVVYTSIIGYLQYIFLAVYICNLAHSRKDYRNLPKTAVGCIPAQLEWLQDLTKLSHTYRNCFFTLGGEYILAFGAFCWLPEMQADKTTVAFYLLWVIIFVVIVLLFPVVSVLEYKWIKKIVECLKSTYIKDLSLEKELNAKDELNHTPDSFHRLVQMLCATQIINSKDYPLKSAWATFYAAFLALLNLTATLLTLTQGLSSILNGFPQIF